MQKILKEIRNYIIIIIISIILSIIIMFTVYYYKTILILNLITFEIFNISGPCTCHDNNNQTNDDSWQKSRK